MPTRSHVPAVRVGPGPPRRLRVRDCAETEPARIQLVDPTDDRGFGVVYAPFLVAVHRDGVVAEDATAADVPGGGLRRIVSAVFAAITRRNWAANSPARSP